MIKPKCSNIPFEICSAGLSSRTGSGVETTGSVTGSTGSVVGTMGSGTGSTGCGKGSTGRGAGTTADTSSCIATETLEKSSLERCL